MSVLEILSGLEVEIQAEYQPKLDKIAAAKAALEAELKVAHDAGFDEGVLQNTVPGDKIYTEADYQAAVVPLQAKIAELELAVKASDESLPGKIEVAVAGALAAFKVELAQAYDAQQVAESEGETGFKSLLG